MNINSSTTTIGTTNIQLNELQMEINLLKNENQTLKVS
jgi:hypothetical protein